MRHGYVTVWPDGLIRETADNLLLRFGDEHHWLARTMVDGLEGWRPGGPLMIPEWKARDLCVPWRPRLTPQQRPATASDWIGGASGTS